MSSSVEAGRMNAAVDDETSRHSDCRYRAEHAPEKPGVCRGADCSESAIAHVDRRRAPRFASDARHRIRCVRIRPAQVVAVVVNASAAGALIETSQRLLPGRCVEIHVETDTERASVRASVARCAVVEVRAGTIVYRGGIAFDRLLPWFAAETVYPLPAADSGDLRDMRAVATPIAL